MRKLKYFIAAGVVLLLFLSAVILQGANPFFGFREKMREKSGLEKTVVVDLLKTEEFLPKITSPLQDEVVRMPFTITGTISVEIDYIEVKIDEGEWKKIEDAPNWSCEVDNLEMGAHTVTVHAVEGEIKGPDIFVAFKVSITPTGVAASDGTYVDKVRVSWTAVSGAEKYYVYRSFFSGGTYAEVGSTTSTFYDDTSVSINTQFYYKVRAYVEGTGYSDYSTNDGGYAGIMAPTDVTASDTLYDKVSITWNNVSNAEKYYIYRSLTSGSGYAEIGNVSSVTAYNDTTAGMGTNYYYKVRAWSTAMGYSPYSDYDGGIKLDPFSGVTKREMVSVPGGTYTQQDTSANSFSHTISAFQMGKYEVTYELWYAVYTWAVSNGYNFANAGDEGHDGSAGVVPTGAKYEPATTVNWRDTIVWCNAYSEISGFSPVYKNGSSQVIKDARDSNGAECDNAAADWSANGYRLPTEGEWQYAASYKDGVSWTPYNYASGATADYNNAGATGLVAWYDSNSGSKTQDVGTKTANALGIHDISGNVWEKCWDWYGSWPGTGQTDYRGPGSGSDRVLRGGSWVNSASFLQVGSRNADSPGSEGSSIGFRLVRTP